MADDCNIEGNDLFGNHVMDVLYLRQTDRQKYLRTNIVLRTLIEGICDEESILSLLLGTPDIVQTIWNDVVKSWKSSIKPGPTAYWDEFQDPVYLGLYVRRELTFPKPTGIQVNVMPFVMARTFEESRLPKNLKPYWDMFIGKKYFSPLLHGHIIVFLISEKQLGKIGYLTIDESFVGAGETQQRPGLHTSNYGKLMISRHPNGDDYICAGRTNKREPNEKNELVSGRLGGGCTDLSMVNCYAPWGQKWAEEGTELVGGIYMASNVSNSCQVWNCMLQPDADGREVIGNLGDVEHMRDFIPALPEVMKANQVYWITDRTPYECLPLKEGTYRQYFRLVTSDVSLWFEEHSTKNPCGVVPDPAVTKIVKGSKFEEKLRLLDVKISNSGPPKNTRSEMCSMA